MSSVLHWRTKMKNSRSPRLFLSRWLKFLNSLEIWFTEVNRHDQIVLMKSCKTSCWELSLRRSSSSSSSSAAAVNVRPLRGGVTAAPQPGASTERGAARQPGSAAVRWAEEGTAQRHCGQEAAPITPGALGWGAGGNDTHWSEGGGRCVKT